MQRVPVRCCKIMALITALDCLLTMTSSLLFNVTTFAYLVSMLCFFIHLASRNEHAGTAGSYIAYGFP